MYIVRYQKMKILENGNLDTKSSGSDTAYMDCKFNEIESRLITYLSMPKWSEEKYLPIISRVDYIEGHLA